MTQLHTINHGFGIVRPTNDVDIVLHIETTRGVPSQTVEALRSIGYDLRDSFDPRDNTAHRFVRGADVVDLVTSRPGADGDEDVVDVIIADHPAPSVTEPTVATEIAISQTLRPPRRRPRGSDPSCSVASACAFGPGVGVHLLRAGSRVGQHLPPGVPRVEPEKLTGLVDGVDVSSRPISRRTLTPS